MSDPLNTEQVKQIVHASGEAAAGAAVRKFVQDYPHFAGPAAPTKQEIPAPLKWAGAIIAALMAAGIIALSIWMVSTLNQLQITVARMDERQQQDTTRQDIRDLQARVTKLEQEKGARAAASPT